MNKPLADPAGLATALAELPGALREAAALSMPVADLRSLALVSRRILCSGLGSSSAHARLLAAQLMSAGVAAYACPLGGEAPGPGDTVVVFSQGLSASVRRVIGALSPEVGIVLVTSVDPDDPESGSPNRRDWLAAAEDNGLCRVPMMGAMEYGSLVRITGPVTGYLTALRLANALGASFSIPLDEILAEVVACLDPKREGPGGEIFDQELSLLGTGIHDACLGNLALKVQEGLLQPAPPILSVDEVAHGPFQEAYPRPRQWVVFTQPTSGQELEGLRRLREMIPTYQSVCEVHSGLDFPCSIFSHEVLWTRAVLAHRKVRGVSTDTWPGQGEDGPLYDWGETAAPPAPRQLALPGLDRWASPEVARRLADHPTAIILPLGSTEQHGAHLPLGTDTRIAEALGERLCRRLPGSFCLPTVPFGIASEHLSFAGTISIGEENFIRFLADILSSLAVHAPAEIMIFSAHGGNEAFLVRNRERLEGAAAPARLLLASIPEQVSQRLVSLADQSGISESEAGWHAGELETSMMLELDAASVRTDQMAPGHLDLVPPAEKLFYPNLADRVPSGVVGDPRRAAGIRAESYLSGWVEELLKFYRSRASVHHTKGTKNA